MTILPTAVDTAASEFRANAERMRALTSELRVRRGAAAQGGPARARERHVARGKLLPRDRVMNLIDPGSPFLELSPLAATGMYEAAIHGAGLITGIGRVAGRECTSAPPSSSAVTTSPVAAFTSGGTPSKMVP